MDGICGVDARTDCGVVGANARQHSSGRAESRTHREGLVDELLQHCGQVLLTHWVTSQVADATAGTPHLSDLWQTLAVCEPTSVFAQNRAGW